METKNSSQLVFKIEKDSEKQIFISSHTYDEIPSFGPGKNDLFDSIININKKNFNNLNISNSNSENEIKLKNKDNIIEEPKLNEANNKIKLKVILNYAYLKDYFIFNLPTKIIYNKEQNLYQFNLNSIINIIQHYSNDKNIFLNENYSISYYTNDENSDLGINLDEEKDEDIKPYYFVGNFPLKKNINYLVNIPSDGILYLKFRKRISKVKSLRYDIFEEENEEEIEDNGNEELTYHTTSKRAKEKKIGYIIKKVFEWKGFRKYTDNKMSLIEAAKKVGLSKKTLDEYYNQIREGKKYNFDFNKHKKDKVNILRGYVKKMNNNNNNINIKENKEKKEKKIKNKNKK